MGDGIHERPDNHESSVSSVSVGHHAAGAFQIIGSIYVQGNKGFESSGVPRGEPGPSPGGAAQQL